MAEIIQEETGKGGKKKAKKTAPHIDMTPMVDLMCLLITFFMLTSALSKPKVMDLILPDKIKDKKEKQEAPKIAKSRTINIILGPDNKVFYYIGLVEDPKNPPPLQETDFSANGIRRILLERNATLSKKIRQFDDVITSGKITMPHDSIEPAKRRLKNEDDTGPIVLIKAYKAANYGNFVDILDEMSIISIAHYIFVDINWIEEKMIETTLGITPA